MSALRVTIIALAAGFGWQMFLAPESAYAQDARDRWQQRRAEMDDYWSNHWNWYDNDYRRYYTRRYHRAPQSSYYRTQPYGYNPLYSQHPYRNPYGRTYDRSYERHGGSIGIGPFQLRWR